jgi:hypothetical protein
MSKEFKQLFLSMTKADPVERATLEEIRHSEWYNGPILAKDQLKDQMKRLIVKHNYLQDKK